MFSFCTALFFTFTTAISIPDTKASQADIDAIKEESAAFSQAIENEDLNKILSYIDSTTIVLPEYHRSLEHPSEIASYYTEFFKGSETKEMHKQLLEVLPFGDYYQEVGTFEHTYKIPGKDWFTYEGKYMTWWKKTTNHSFKIVAHIWSGNRWYEPQLLNFVQVATQEGTALIPKTPLEHQIVENIKATTKAVKAGDSKKQLEGYMEDAIYMTYYDPPFIGKKAITDYFMSHNDPNVTRDSLVIQPYWVIEMGDYSLQQNKYYVEWTYEGTSSYIHGKGLNLRKKMKDGSLKMYRQILNHDLPPTPMEKKE